MLARAYIDQGFGNRALSALDKDESRYADLLRAEIYWKNRKWPQATKILFRLVQSTEAKPGEKLDQQQATFIMNLAVSMALGGDTRGTDNLVSNYGSSMDKTLYKDAFRLMGLEFNTDWGAIQKKFKILVKKFHPDRNSGNKELEDKLKKITMAYSHLKMIMIQK